MDLAHALSEFGFKVNVSMVILTVALLMCRIVPVLVLSPLLGGETTPPNVKIGMGMVLSLVMFPAVADRVSMVPVRALPFIALLLKEIFIGLSLSFVVSAIFQAAQIGGNIVDVQAGAAQAQVHVPQTQGQATIFSTFKLMLSVTLFLTLNGHHLVIEALADSFVKIPVDKFPNFGHGMWPFFDLIMRTFGDMMKIGLAIAAPAMVAAFVTDLSLGMINRVAPQLQVFFISMAVKPLVATVMICVVIRMILDRINGEFVHTLVRFGDALRLLM